MSKLKKRKRAVQSSLVGNICTICAQKNPVTLSLSHCGGEAVKRPLLDGSHSETNQPR